MAGALLVCAGFAAQAQDRLEHMPGYNQYQRMNRDGADAVKFGSLTVTWKDEGRAFEYWREGKRAPARNDPLRRRTTTTTGPTGGVSTAQPTRRMGSTRRFTAITISG